MTFQAVHQDTDLQLQPVNQTVRVLVLDASRPCMEAAADMLRLVGYSVYAFQDLNDALLALDTLAPHLVLVDVGSESYKAIEQIRSLRGRATNFDLRVVAMSVEVVPADRKGLHAAGVGGWLVKPFTIEDLQAVAALPSPASAS